MTNPVASSPSLPPDVNQALERNGLNLAQIKSYMAMMGLKPKDLPMALKQAGIEDVPGYLKAQGIAPSHMPAILTALGVPADQQPAMLAEMGFVTEEKKGEAEAQKGDTVAPAAVKSDKSLPKKPLSLMPDPKTILKNAVERDPKKIEADRTGYSGRAGLTLHQPTLGATRLGLEVGLEKELLRTYLSGNAANGWILDLGAVADANLTAGGDGVDLSVMGGVKPFVGKTWGFNVPMLNVSTETRVGVYGLAEVGGRAGVLNGPTAGLVARVGGGVEAGPLYMQLTRDFATNGSQTQASAGAILRF